MLKVRNLAKQVAHSGCPISIGFSKELDVQLHQPLSKKITMGLT
jgi:hypothetical protein